MPESPPAAVLPGTLAFVGGGNLGRALIGGLIARGQPPLSILVAEPDEARREALAADFGVAVSGDNRAVAAAGDLLVLAVKPQVMPAVCRELAGAVAEGTLVVSVAAGVTTASLRSWLGHRGPLVRAMPNTPALIGEGATGLYADDRCDAAARVRADRLLAAVGLTLWVSEESLMDAVTAVGGSGPAYFLALIEALEAAAVAEGLDPDTARRLVLATAAGTARLARESVLPPAALRAQVTSPGGTTAAALAVLEDGQWSALIARAVSAATRRARELARGG